MSERRIARLALRMVDVRRHQKGAVEEDLLALTLRHLVELPILLRVPGVPLKAGARSQVIGKAGHIACIL